MNCFHWIMVSVWVRVKSPLGFKVTQNTTQMSTGNLLPGKSTFLSTVK